MRRFILFLFIAGTLLGCQSKSSESDTLGYELELGVHLKNPFVHSVYFWFKEGTTAEQLKAFYADTEKLREIEAVKAMYTGKAASTDRPIVERSYDFAVIVHFENLAGHDAYQVDPIHLAMLEKHAGLWERVMITDVE